MKLKIGVAGATGWAGSMLCSGIVKQEDLELVFGVSRTYAGKGLSSAINSITEKIPVYQDISAALINHSIDVLVEYTKPQSAKEHILEAVANGVNVVVGTSGLSREDYESIEIAAKKHNVAVLAVGNFALTAVLLQKFSEMAARYIPNFEVIDYAHENKADSPSGSAREMAAKLGAIQEATQPISLAHIIGDKESRGVRLNGVQVHSIRLPGHIIGLESIFGLEDEKLTMRHDAGSSAKPYVQGALLAIRKVGTLSGFHRGLDSVMDF
jgi:4-hydroxy-tetrahydrodipicolinate reductase